MYLKSLPKGSIGILLPTIGIEKVLGEAFEENSQSEEPQIDPVNPDDPGDNPVQPDTPTNPETPVDPETPAAPAYAILFTSNPTQEAIQLAINTSTPKPSEPLQYDTRGVISTPTDAIIAIPRDWGQLSIVDNGTGWAVSYALNEDNPSYVINGVTYNVYDTAFGVGIYTITF